MEVIKGFVTRVNSFTFYLYISPMANMADELKEKVLWSIKYLSEFLTDSHKSLKNTRRRRLEIILVNWFETKTF